MDEARLAWLAGVFEGEGCIAFTGKYSVDLSINMTDEDVVRRCHEFAQVGQVVGPYRVDVPGQKPIWGWHVTRSADVRHILLALWPWMGERRLARIELALDRLRKVRREGRCKRGHNTNDPSNVYTSPKGQNFCRACLRLREQARPPRSPDNCPAPHGTKTKYGAGCRCTDCRAASAAYVRARYHAKNRGT